MEKIFKQIYDNGIKTSINDNYNITNFQNLEYQDIGNFVVFFDKYIFEIFNLIKPKIDYNLKIIQEYNSQKNLYNETVNNIKLLNNCKSLSKKFIETDYHRKFEQFKINILDSKIKQLNKQEHNTKQYIEEFCIAILKIVQNLIQNSANSTNPAIINYLSSFENLLTQIPQNLKYNQSLDDLIQLNTFEAVKKELARNSQLSDEMVNKSQTEVNRFITESNKKKIIEQQETNVRAFNEDLNNSSNTEPITNELNILQKQKEELIDEMNIVQNEYDKTTLEYRIKHKEYLYESESDKQYYQRNIMILVVILSFLLIIYLRK